MGYQSRKKGYKSRRERYETTKRNTKVTLIFALLALITYLMMQRHEIWNYLKTYTY